MDKREKVMKGLDAEVLREIINGNARVSGCAKNDAKGTMYIEFTFWENEPLKEETSC